VNRAEKNKLLFYFYPVKFRFTEKTIRVITIFLVVYLLGFALAMALFEIRPFWNDEWRLIYNLKFKSEKELWGVLDLLQECPRTYLICLKKITSFFDYSYQSLRFPALITAAAGIFLMFRLRKLIFPSPTINGYLFILILLSSQTFTDYIVQTKQYEMELFLTLAALLQLKAFYDLRFGMMKVGSIRYILLCLSLIVAPFFSYTYTIAVLPVFPICFFLILRGFSSNCIERDRWLLLKMGLPLGLALASILVFYRVDLSHVMANSRMYHSYRNMLGMNEHENPVLLNMWKFFSLVGSGFVFEIIFGLVGLASFLFYLAKHSWDDLSNDHYSFGKICRIYAALLISITLMLIASQKLMGGVARLVAFTVPSVSILIIYFLDHLNTAKGLVSRLGKAVSLVIFVGLIGNVITTFINVFTYPEYKNRITTYHQTGLALKDARLKKAPLLFTEGVKGDKIEKSAPQPGTIATQTITDEQKAGLDYLCPEVVLKVNPEYKVWDTVQVYQAPDAKWVKDYVAQLPEKFTIAVFTDGIHFETYRRKQ